MTDPPLAAYEVGRYADLAGRSLPVGFVWQFIPSLAAMVSRAEQLAGRPLTRDEVFKVRDACMGVVTEVAAAKAVEERRGYVDLETVDPWPGWVRLRGEMAGDTLPG